MSFIAAAALMAGGTYLAAREARKGAEGAGFEQIPLTENQKKAEQYLADIVSGSQTFDPRKIAEFSPAMKEAIIQVDRIMKGGIPEIESAIDVIAKRMTGPVEEVPGLEGLFTKTRELGAELLGKDKRALALMGNLPSESSAGERIYGRTLQDIMNELVTSAYPFYSQGLAAKLQAPMDLASLATAKTTLPLTLATSIGALPYERQQSILDAIFEAQRKTQEYPYQAAANLLGQQMYAYNPGTYQPSTFSQIAQPLAMLGSAALMRGAGGEGGRLTFEQQASLPYYQGLSNQWSPFGNISTGQTFTNPMAVYGSPYGY